MGSELRPTYASGSLNVLPPPTVQAVVEAGFLVPMKNLLQHQKENIVREAVWALSNVTAGNVNQVQMVIEADLIPLVVEILKTVWGAVHVTFM